MTAEKTAAEALRELYKRNSELEPLNPGLRLLDGPETEEDLMHNQTRAEAICLVPKPSKPSKRRAHPEADKPVGAGMYGIWVTVPYTGCEGWSCNHYKVAGNMAWKRSPEAAAVRMAIGAMLSTALMETEWKPRSPLHIIISGTFRDRRRCVDLHNTIKVVCDCVRDATGVDDQAFKVTTELPRFDKAAEPEIRIEIRQL